MPCTRCFSSARMGRTNRSLRMAITVSCNTPAWLRRRRSFSRADWTSTFRRSIERRIRARAGLAEESTVPSGRILPSSSRTRSRKSAVPPASASRRVKGLFKNMPRRSRAARATSTSARISSAAHDSPSIASLSRTGRGSLSEPRLGREPSRRHSRASRVSSCSRRIPSSPRSKGSLIGPERNPRTSSRMPGNSSASREKQSFGRPGSVMRMRFDKGRRILVPKPERQGQVTSARWGRSQANPRGRPRFRRVAGMTCPRTPGRRVCRRAAGWAG